MPFNSKNPRIAQWAKQHAAELVTDVVKTTRQRLKAAVVKHVSGELNDKDYFNALEEAIGDEARAQMIARTESMLAVHHGQREAWQQAADDGLLSKKARRAWIAAEDACDICQELDGEEATLDGEYPGGYEGPPAHPNCRCSEGLA